MSKEATVTPRVKKPKMPSKNSRQPQGVVQFFRESPLAKVKLNLKRKREFARKIEL